MKKVLYILSIVLLALVSCKKDDAKVQTPVFSNEDIVLGTTTVQITVKYDYPAVLKTVNGVISTNSDMGNPQTIAAEMSGLEFKITFTNLNSQTMYYYYYEYSNGMDEGLKSDIWNFTTNDYYLPIVTTSDITDITRTSARCGGEVIDDGGLEISARGLCWGTNHNPTISNEHTTNGGSHGTFTSYITGLTATTKYYVRAYATNSCGTSYGDEKEMTTLIGPPVGAIDGLFSISAANQVWFSMGNLQYKASTNTWRFAENQYDCIGENNANISQSYSDWIDLFAFGSGNIPIYIGNPQYPTPLSTDWGGNAISNGGNQANYWRSLTYNELNYAVNTRSTPSGTRYAKAKVNGINGLILLPDNWDNSNYNLSNINTSNVDYSTNVISLSVWNNTFETNGAVFLPASGTRNGTNVVSVGEVGAYWSANYEVSHYHGYTLKFNASNVLVDANQYYWTAGCSVRLVRDVE